MVERVTEDCVYCDAFKGAKIVKIERFDGFSGKRNKSSKKRLTAGSRPRNIRSAFRGHPLGATESWKLER
jgi:hypothetical protein